MASSEIAALILQWLLRDTSKTNKKKETAQDSGHFLATDAAAVIAELRFVTTAANTTRLWLAVKHRLLRDDNAVNIT